MTLLLTVLVAVASTVVWYLNPHSVMKVSMLVWMFWGASLMWLVDAVVEYLEEGADYFAPSAADMLNDTFLGASVIALALVVWLVTVLVTDPKGTIRDHLLTKHS